MDKQPTLFTLPKHTEEAEHDLKKGKPRLNKACRNQYEIRHSTLDQLLPKEHLARDVWKYVEGLDLSIVLAKIEAVEGKVGRSATDPKILLSIWLLGILKSINSARVLEEYCQEHDAFKWLCGGVNINHHTLSDFSTLHADQLSCLLTQSVAVLAQNSVISLERISQDGLKVRASAGYSSFKRKETLEDHLVLATELVSDLKQEAEKDPGACRRRLAAVELRAAEEKAQKIKSALNELEKIRKGKEEYAKRECKQVEDLEKCRASVTDPEARVMQMPCKGKRPAYNVQFASANKGKAIVAVEVINKVNDKRQIMPMMNQFKKRYDIISDNWSCDSGYIFNGDIDTAREKYPNCKIHMPVTDEKNVKDPFKRRPKDSEAVGDWRERMGTEEAKKIYKERSETAELVNAQARHRGLHRFLVRGLDKVTCVAFLYAITQNMSVFFGKCVKILNA